MLIREKDYRILLQIFGKITEPVEVLAYGSRVTGGAHDGSDLDLVIRRLDGQPVSTEVFETVIEKIRESNIPILVDLHDWALLPENFHRQIEKQHEVLFVQKNQFIMKPRLIFDIACFTGQPSMSGSLRYAIEVLKRFVESEKFDIVAICSLPEEEFALRNLSRYFHYQLPFQSKDTEHFVLPDTPASSGKSFLRKIEDALTKILPDNRILKFVTDSIRTVKWKLSPPPFLTERKSSPFYEKLVTESDIYFSPFHPLIPELSCKKSIRKIIVIHDLIPVIFANLYKGHRFFQKYPWESVTPDTLVFTDSESTKRDLLKYYPTVLPEQVRTILLAADQRFSPCFDRNKIESILNKYSIPANIPYIFSVAALDIRKNFDHVMNCFSQYSLPQHGIETNCRLVLTGVNGWQDRKFKKFFSRLPEKVKEKIIFTGYVDDEDLPFLYSGAACFCYMSIYEGFGLPPLEAMQCGTPVITSNTSSLPEVVGDAGIMLDPHDVEGLVDAFNRVLNNETLRKSMTAKGLEQAGKFSWDQCVEIILEKILEKNSE